MATATCALCGASNSIGRVYLGMKSPRPNLVAVSCSECGKVSSQLRTLGDYLLFALLYGAIALALIVAGLAVTTDRAHVAWIATAAAILPFGFLPPVWTTWRAQHLAEQAPTDDLTVAEKLIYMMIAIAVIAAVVGGGVYLYTLLLGSTPF